MPKPVDVPTGQEFGQFISAVTTAFGITGAQAIAIFGGTPNGRNWMEISKESKDVMKAFPKQSD